MLSTEQKVAGLSKIISRIGVGVGHALICVATCTSCHPPTDGTIACP